MKPEVKCNDCGWIGGWGELIGVMWKGDRGECPQCYSNGWTRVEEDLCPECGKSKETPKMSCYSKFHRE